MILNFIVVYQNRKGINVTEQELLRTLRTVGLSCFIENYELFNDLYLDKTNIQNTVEFITSSNVSESSARTKAYAAKRIFKEKLNYSALILISNSSLISDNLIKKSNHILSNTENIPITNYSPYIEPCNDNLQLIENNSTWNNKIEYDGLNAKQKENYNLLKLGAVLADYGFDLLRLNDDWQGADCIANHIDGSTYLKIQLKGRLTIDKKYLDKDIYIAFRNVSEWYLYPHDDFVDYLQNNNMAVESNSWLQNGHYSWPTLSNTLQTYLSKFKL